MAKSMRQKREEWGRAFGLVAIPYFGRHHPSAPAGTHLMMQDGQDASFAMHLARPSPLLIGKEPLRWAWSSNVRHAVVLNPKTREARIRRWDDPAYEEIRRIASPGDAKKLVEELEKTPRQLSGADVIQGTLASFNMLRSAIEERGGTPLDVVIAFNAALLLADKGGDIPQSTLAEAVEVFRRQRQPGFEGTISERVRSYPVGDFARILLEEQREGAPYLLDVNLLLRHASGLLYQEAHRSLAKEFIPGGRQPSLFEDAMPSAHAAVRREPPPTYVHYTPPWLARGLLEAALRNIESSPPDQTLDVLDPACGSGVFLIETERELERYPSRSVALRGMDKSNVAGTMTRFSLGQASRDLENVSVTQSVLDGVDSLITDWGKADIILMNPPFKAWRDLGDYQETVRQVLGKHMQGRPDLYLAFIVRAAESLKPSGVLASVVPAPFFTAKSAMKVRTMLGSGDFRVRMLGLFRGFKTFDKATVEAAVIVVARSTEDVPVRVVVAQRGYAEKAIRWLRAISPTKAIERAGFDIYNAASNPLKADGALLCRRRDQQFADMLGGSIRTAVEDLFTVRLGIRGLGARGFQKVLLVKEGEIDRLAPTDAQKKFFRPVADRIEQGRIVPSWYVFYPYGTNRELLLETEKELVTAVPGFYQERLRPAKDALEARQSIRRKGREHASRNWWEPSEPVSTWLAARTSRLVSQEFGRKGNFGFDKDGRYAVVAGNGWCWNAGPPDKDVMFAYLAILNSRLFERLLRAYCPRLQGGQFRLEARFVHRVPLPALLPDPASPLSTIGKCIHLGTFYDEAELDRRVLEAYGVSEERHDAIVQAEDRWDSGRFSRLASQWRAETGHLSRVKHRIAHPAYQRIVGMGMSAIGPILRDLQRRGPDDWFWALSKITGQNPITTQMAGKTREMTEAWLRWGRTNRFLND